MSTTPPEFDRLATLATKRGFILRKKRALAGRNNFGRYRLDTRAKPVRVVLGGVNYTATLDEVEVFLNDVKPIGGRRVDGCWIEGPGEAYRKLTAQDEPPSA